VSCETEIARRATSTAVDPSQQQRELVLAALRTVVKRLDQIREEVVLAGVALSTGSIDPQTAIRWSETVAPGCLSPEVTATFIAKGWDLP
jgi:hypothetical protein